MKAGDAIRYTTEPTNEQATWASCDDPRGVLKLGGRYVLEEVDVHSFHTKLTLVGVSGHWNSILFEQ